eukprot:m.66808 g.66808  ORF g.66808 m.66808 type:complete len:199 (-) comp13782_c0_seq3:675-1271(-)
MSQARSSSCLSSQGRASKTSLEISSQILASVEFGLKIFSHSPSHFAMMRATSELLSATLTASATTNSHTTQSRPPRDKAPEASVAVYSTANAVTAFVMLTILALCSVLVAFFFFGYGNAILKLKIYHFKACTQGAKKKPANDEASNHGQHHGDQRVHVLPQPDWVWKSDSWPYVSALYDGLAVHSHVSVLAERLSRRL